MGGGGRDLEVSVCNRMLSQQNMKVSGQEQEVGGQHGGGFLGRGSEWLGPGSECVQQEMSWWDSKVNFGDPEVTGQEQNVGGWYPDIGLQGPPASALTPEDPVGAAKLLAPRLGFKPGAVVRCEVDKCVVRQALALQHLQYLTCGGRGRQAGEGRDQGKKETPYVRHQLSADPAHYPPHSLLARLIVGLTTSKPVVVQPSSLETPSTT